jgi:hypothetical protein
MPARSWSTGYDGKGNADGESLLCCQVEPSEDGYIRLTQPI